MTPEIWQSIGAIIAALATGSFVKTLLDGRKEKRGHLREVKRDDYQALKDDNQRMLTEREEAQKDAREARQEAMDARTQREVMRQMYEREATWAAILGRLIVQHGHEIPPRPPMAAEKP